MKCHICRKDFAQRSLAGHLARQHGIYHTHLMAGEEEAEKVYTPVPAKPATWTGIHYPETGNWGCLVPGCSQGRPGKGAGSSWDLRWHFAFRDAPGRVRMAGNNWFPCRLCGIQTASAGTPANEASKTCRYMPARWDQHAATRRGAMLLGLFYKLL